MSVIVLCVCAACVDLCAMVWKIRKGDYGAACVDLCAMVWKIRKGDYDMAILMFCLFIIMISCIIINISRL